MRGRAWLWISLTLNVVLLACLGYRRTPTVPPVAAPSDPGSLPELGPGVVRTNTVIRRQNFVWNQIESADYATYIANLRRIACPETTIRDIILADINQLFARRRATNLLSPQHQWWRSTPDPEVVSAAAAAALALEQERRDLLTQLLGTDWESADYPFPSGYSTSALDGPVLGSLPLDVKAAVRETERTTQARLDRFQLEAATTGQAPNPADLARVQLESRQALANLLTPEQLEEYLLRYSSTARALRTQLQGIDLAPEEFRQLFRSLDALDTEEATARVSGTPPPPPVDREAQRQDALRQTLGEERFAAYQNQQDPLYRQSRDLALQIGATPEQVVPLAAIVRLTQEEEARIRTDETLTSEDRLEQLQATREAQRDSLRQLLGETSFQRYLENETKVWENERP